MSPPADAVLAFVSGIPLILLGILLVLIRPRTPRQTFFGAFAILWGIQVLTANVGRMLVDVALHQDALLFSHAVMAVQTLVLVHFVVRLGHRRGHIWYTGAASLLALAAGSLLVLHPESVVQEVALRDGLVSVSYGWAATFLFHIPVQLAFVLVIALLYGDMRRARSGTPRHRLRGLVIAFGLYVSYQSARIAAALLDLGGGFASFASSFSTYADSAASMALFVTFTGSAIVLLAIIFHAVLRPPPPEATDWPLVAALVFPMVVALLEQVLAGGGIAMETLGFWRLVSVAVLVYTVANHQLFDLDLRLKRLAGPTAATALVLFGIPLALGLALGDIGWEATFITLLPEVVGVGAILVFRNRIGEVMFPGVKDTPDYVHQRKLELYRASLDDALRRGIPADDPELEQLRVRFEVSPEEHRIVVALIGTTTRTTGNGAVAIRKGTVLLDRYEVKELLGSGPHRTTVRARDRKARREVAVKMVDTKAFGGAAAALVRHEARISASIAHPNVLPVYDVEDDAERLIIVMDHAAHGDLASHLRRHGKKDITQATRMVREILEGLTAVHRRGIVHANLKPKNLLLDDNDHVLISDFAASVDTLGEGFRDPVVKEARHALFDPLYTSPELLLGQDPDARTDVYQVGILYHQLLTNRSYLPIAGKSDLQIRDLVLHHPPDLDIDAPRWVLTVLAKALAKAPDARYSDAAAMLADLQVGPTGA